MNQTEDIKELVAALSKAQAQMEPAKFNKRNSHFKQKYADFTSCMEACRKPLSDNGLCVMQYCETNTEGKLSLVTMLAHVSGQWIKSHMPLSDLKTPQTFGSEITYMKRYGLSAMLGIVADEDINADDDAEAAMCRDQQKPPAKPEIFYIDHQKFCTLTAEAAKLKPETRQAIMKWIGSDSFNSVREDKYQDVLGAIQRGLKADENNKS